MHEVMHEVKLTQKQIFVLLYCIVSAIVLSSFLTGPKFFIVSFIQCVVISYLYIEMINSNRREPEDRK